MKVAAVWGASGYLGSSLTEALLADGWSVRTILRTAESLPQHLKAQVKDIKLLQFHDDEQEYIDAVHQVDVFFNCVGAPTSDVAESALYIDAIKKLANATNKSQVSQLIHLSTVAVYGEVTQSLVTTDAALNGVGAYARVRMEAEKVLLSISNQTTKVIVIRIPMVVGSSMTSDLFQRIYKTLKFGIFFHPGSKNSKLNCIGISKLIKGMLAVSRMQAEESCVLQLSDSVMWVEIIALIQKIKKRNIWRIYVPQFFVKVFSCFIFRVDMKQKISIFRNESSFASSDVFLKDALLEEIATIKDLEQALESNLTG